MIHAHRVRQAGDRRDVGGLFERGSPGTIPIAIPNDHVPFLRADIPAALLIDYDFGGPDPVRGTARNRFWHTPEDRLDRVSAESLAAAGQVVMATVTFFSP